MFSPGHFHERRPELVAPVRVDATGGCGPTRGEARGAGWRRTTYGFYVPADVSDDVPQQRIVEAAVSVPDGGAVTGWAALNWRGARWFEGLTPGRRARRPVTIATAGRTVRAQRGIAICEESLSPVDLATIDGLRVTSSVRSVCFETRYASSDRLAVVALDMAAYSDLVSIDEMWSYALAHAGWTGIPRCRWAIGYADENAWSPPEVLMRLVWQLDAGRPRPRCNVPVFDRHGRHIATPDLLDAEAGVAGEYDGELHLAGKQRAIDVRREAALREVGLETVTMVAADLKDPSMFIRRLHGAYGRARQEPDGRRAWTIEPPGWWIPTLTVAQRRALDAEQRARWLRHRRVA